MGFLKKIKAPFKAVGSAVKTVAKDVYSGTKKTIGAIGRGTEEVFEGIGAVGAAGVDVVQENPLLVAGVATGNPLLTGVGALQSTGGAFFTDPVTGALLPTPQTGQGGTVPYVPYTNYIQETPERQIIQVPSQGQSQQGFSFNPLLIYGGIGLLAAIYLFTKK
jgi:hypothetical protein